MSLMPTLSTREITLGYCCFNHAYAQIYLFWYYISFKSWKIALLFTIISSAGSGGGGSGATDSSSEELNFNTYQQATSVPPQPQPPFVLAKKRFRTKFTQDQKEKMLEFAEKLGWRIPREDDTEVQRFCSQVGVKRQVFKVWLHNNKNPSAKKNPQEEP